VIFGYFPARVCIIRVDFLNNNKTVPTKGAIETVIMLGFKITSATDYVTSTFMSIATYLNRVYTFRKPERS